MQPDLIVGLIKQKQPPLDILQKRFKSDVQWRLDEQSPLGKAEWIKFLVLYTDSIPRRIQSLAKLKRIQRYFGFSRSTVFSQGCSKISGTYHEKAALFLKDAH
jgi:hypothetical protein